jgi:aerobic-type carbon monoxide dehydrogenase small subunit (CoxS/CutS family)
VEAEPEPTAERVRHALAGNLCRCGAYPRIEEAIIAYRGQAADSASGKTG